VDNVANTLIDRRQLLRQAAAGSALAAWPGLAAGAPTPQSERPNLIYVFADQWRAQATGYAGDPNAITPNLDEFATRNLNITHAVSGCPVCSPHRGSLLTGCYPLTHGIFVNDVPLSTKLTSFGDALRSAGYQTGYIGKWHVDGRGRSSFIPRARRQGFEFWRVLECTHDYNHSFYYGDDPTKRLWDGYDAEAQTRAAQQYLRERAGGGPFALFLSWGPPHAPYQTAPEKFRKRIDQAAIKLRPNVPMQAADRAYKDLAGYYAHMAALDDSFGQLLSTLREAGLERNTLVVFTSDHGDMLGSQGQQKKQQPYEESIRVPFLLRDPRVAGPGRKLDLLLNSPDIMPTMLGLCGVPVPGTVEGADYSGLLRGGEGKAPSAALLTCPQPFGQWSRKVGGREFRGVRTHRHTYVRELAGPWLLYDNEQDPYQEHNLVNAAGAAGTQRELDEMLMSMLKERGDEFLPGPTYLARWGYQVDANGTVPYHR
jgi:arylsulfatase A-like enzyme